MFYQKRKQKKWIQKEHSPQKPKPPKRYPMPQKWKTLRHQQQQRQQKLPQQVNTSSQEINYGYPNQNPNPNPNPNQWNYQTGWEDWPNEQRPMFSQPIPVPYADISFHSRPQDDQTNLFQPTYYDFDRVYNVQTYQKAESDYYPQETNGNQNSCYQSHNQTSMEQRQHLQQRQQQKNSNGSASNRFPDAQLPPNRRL